MIYKYIVKICAFFYVTYRVIRFTFKSPNDWDDWDKLYAKQFVEAKMKRGIKK